MTPEIANHEEVFPTLSRGRTVHDYLRILIRRRWAVLGAKLTHSKKNAKNTPLSFIASFLPLSNEPIFLYDKFKLQ